MLQPSRGTHLVTVYRRDAGLPFLLSVAEKAPPDTRVSLFLVNARPEDVPPVSDVGDLFVSTFDVPNPVKAVRVQWWLRQIHARALQGSRELVLIDSVTDLVRAYGLENARRVQDLLELSDTAETLTIVGTALKSGKPWHERDFESLFRPRPDFLAALAPRKELAGDRQVG